MKQQAGGDRLRIELRGWKYPLNNERNHFRTYGKRQVKARDSHDSGTGTLIVPVLRERNRRSPHPHQHPYHGPKDDAL